ncbi:cellulase family glycosylhydrolase [Klebsiella pneumoniae]|nr:cellulase family glycosylhydrolase [Klebsiella pneumoniae]
MKNRYGLIFFLVILSQICSSFAYGENLIHGVGVHPYKYKGTSESFVSLMQDYDVQSFRTDFPWGDVESTKGKYTFPKGNMKSILDLVDNKNITPLLILGYGNKNYEDFTPGNPRGKPTKQSTIDAYVNYARWTAENVKNPRLILEIWNEWIQMAGKVNRSAALSNESALIYAKLAIDTCKAIKSVNPDITVIIGGTSPFDKFSTTWLENVIKNGAMDCADGISLHPYDYSRFRQLNANRTIASISTMHDQLQSTFGKSFPFYITEIGVPDGSSSSKSPDQVSAYLNDFYQKANSLGYIKGIWWYDFINDGSDKNNREHNFGLLDHTLEPKSSAKMFKDLSQSSTR